MLLIDSCEHRLVNQSNMVENSHVPLFTRPDLTTIACDDWTDWLIMLFFHLSSLARVIFTPSVVPDTELDASLGFWRMVCRSAELAFFFQFHSPNFRVNCFFLSDCQHFI
jgi:hypothetical protein